MADASAAELQDVFINCPFDTRFAPVFRALVFAIRCCGFRPRSALEIDDGGQARIEKIFGIIAECPYGIHDLSRTELDAESNLPRFNMPLELGIFLGARRYGNRQQRAKRALILDVEKRRYQRFISDLAGMDIHEHGADPMRALRATRDWLANASRRRLPSAARVERIFRRFLADIPELGAALEFRPDDIPYFDFDELVADWLVNASATPSA